MMTIEQSCAFMLHIPYTAFKPFRDNNSEMTSTHDMELPTATPSYVFGTDAWAFSFTLTYSPFGYAAPVVKLDSAGIGGGKVSILSDCFYLMLVQSDTTSHKKSLAVRLPGSICLQSMIVDANIVDVPTTHNKYTNNFKPL